ncbi:uroporphyrinogen-III synthase [Kingella potus]|uniref:Uroporphyrinogen-III synthase n=1 Tax=Kingella potus TaxID=265175 RepID=A0A377R2U7_9NEIS|nr:uroporphyrinogen-III synthase [Kingella potus]
MAASPFSIESDSAALAALPQHFQTACAVFWVSPSAVAAAAPYLDFSDGRKAQITVGQGSRQALQAYCPHPVLSPDSGNDSEAVLRMAVWNTLPRGADILIVRGHGGREFLADALRQHGFAVHAAEVYFRRPQSIDWQAVAAARPDAAWIASAEAVRGLFAQAGPAFTQMLQSLLYFTNHQRVADALYAAGAKRVAVVGKLAADLLQRYTEQSR